MSKAVGVIGEDLATKYVNQQGFTVIKRNFYSRFGEVDIIAQKGEYIVFIEVKTRKTGSGFSGLDAVDVKKQKKIIKTAMVYLSENELNLQPRFDVISMEYKTISDFKCFGAVNYIENAFLWRDEYNEIF